MTYAEEEWRARLAEHNREHGAWSPKLHVNGGATLPDLVVTTSNPAATAKGLAELFAERDDFLSNGHTPIRVVVNDDDMPHAIEVTPEAVRVYAHQLCKPVKVRQFKKDGAARIERIPVGLSRDLAQLYLNGLEGQWGLRPFRGITTAPILNNGGAVRIARGYDEASGLWCHNVPDLNLPERPTELDAKAALRRIRQFFRTFPFADGVRVPEDGIEVIDLTQPPGLDESTFLAALLTACSRQSLDTAPGFLIRAPNYSGAGSGKGLLLKAVCMVASGVKPSAFTGGHDANEFDKRLTAALIEARPAVFLDNFNAKELKSDTLASALTESPAMVRTMGHSKNVPLHTRTFIGITGNSVEIAEDMARRIITTNLDARMEDPEQRKFAPGVLDRVLEARADLLSDALTIWRWGRQTVLTPGKALGSYEVWAQWCRDPLLMLGARDPVDRIDEIKAADPRRRALVAFFDVWWAVHGDAVVKSTEVAHEVKEYIDANPRKSEGGEPMYSRQKIASFLEQNAGARLGGYVFEQLKDNRNKRPITHYKLTKMTEA
jgi:hypothetical protein